MDKVKKTKNKKNDIYKILLGLIIVISLGIATFYSYIFVKVNGWKDKIYPNVKVYNVDLSGLKEDEAIEVLRSKYGDVIKDKIILAKYDDKEFTISYRDLEVEYNEKELVNEALKFGKDKGIIDRYKLIKYIYEVNLKPEITYNKEKGNSFIDSIVKDINKEKKEGTLIINNGYINVTKDDTGIKVKENEFISKFEYSINGNINEKEEVIIEVLKEEAKRKYEELIKVNGIISEYKSYFYNNQDGRITNMKIASETISGSLLMPGEVFSYNELIGETTKEKGYALANTYVANKIVPDYGGGICQVSTALYRAAMRANLRSVERTNHSMIVSYSEPSLDATVANGYIDYKFKNDYNSPIYIEAYVLSDNVTIKIYGNTNEKGNRSYELVSEIHKTYEFETEYLDDENLPLGEEVVFRNGMNGYESSSYLVTYENGQEINREKISTDYYAKSNKVIKRGIKKQIRN